MKIWITVLIKNDKPNSNLLSVVHTLHMHSLIIWPYFKLFTLPSFPGLFDRSGKDTF